MSAPHPGGATPEQLTERFVQEAKLCAGIRHRNVIDIVDFGAGIRSIGEDVGELQLVIFGNPRIGAQALAADPMAALDLPGKVLVFDTGNGTAMAYEVPAEMLAEWNIPSDAPVLQVMADTLDRITSQAAE